jgi:hypothetical protein
MIRIEGSGLGPWRLVQKDSMQTNTVRHVFDFDRVCSYHSVYSFVFDLTCGRPPRSKEIGDVQVMKLPVQPQVIWALS